MKKRIVRIISLVLCLMVFSALNMNAYAVSYSYPSLSEKNYCEFIAPNNITVYRDQACKTVGTCSPAKTYTGARIDKGDDCRIYKITSSYVKVNYPTPSGRKTAYMKPSALKLPSTPNFSFKSCGKATTYKTANGKSYGYTEKNDYIYCCLASSSLAPDWVPIIYTAKKGNQGYKFGFVKFADYRRIWGAPY